MRMQVTAAEMLAMQVMFEGDDCDFGVDVMSDDTRKEMRSMAVHLLAVALVDEEALQQALDAIDKPTEQEAEDETFDVTSKAVHGHYDEVLEKLGLTKADAGLEWTKRHAE